jgi:hypothetical protein
VASASALLDHGPYRRPVVGQLTWHFALPFALHLALPFAFHTALPLATTAVTNSARQGVRLNERVRGPGGHQTCDVLASSGDADLLPTCGSLDEFGRAILGFKDADGSHGEVSNNGLAGFIKN